MCGLFGGLSSHCSNEQLKNVQALGVLSNFRGMHSTGIVTGVTNTKRTHFRRRKVLGPSLPFLYTDAFDELVTKKDKADKLTLVAGHTRHATVGAIDLKNAHPFQYNNIIGMHNGTAPTFADKSSDRADSYYIIKSVAEDGLEDTLGKFKTADAYALVIVDTLADKLFIARNTRRTLVFAKQFQNDYFWSSERRMAEFVLGDKHTVKIEDVPDHVLFEFNISKGQLVEATPYEKPVEKTYSFSGGAAGQSKGGNVVRYTPPEHRAASRKSARAGRKAQPTSVPTTPHLGTRTIRSTTKGAPELNIPAKDYFDAVGAGCLWCSTTIGAAHSNVQAVNWVLKGEVSNGNELMLDDYSYCCNACRPEVEEYMGLKFYNNNTKVN